MSKEHKESNQSEKFKLTTEEALELINELKKKVNETTLNFPQLGKRLEFNVYAQKDGTKFIINISRNTIDKRKCTYQGRTYINNIPLLRLDITNSTHMNSNGEKIKGNHLHIYNEETEMREAIPFNVEDADLYEYCLQFFKKFNIIQENWEIEYQTEL